MTRIVYVFIFLLCSASLFAQPTFLKNYSFKKDTITSGFRDIQRLTPTKIFGINRLQDGVGRTPIQLYLLDNQGNITHTQAIPFKTGDDIYSWKHQNSIYVLVSEETGGALRYPWHVLQLDSNLTIVKDQNLDSTMTGLSNDYNRASLTTPLRLLNGDIIFQSYYGHKSRDFKKSIFKIHLMSSTGQIKRSIEVANTYQQAFAVTQNPSHIILWNYFEYTSQTTGVEVFRTIDTNLVFKDSLASNILPYFSLPFNNSTYRNYLTTKDGGLVFVYWDENDFKKYMVKYDSSLKKQWTILVPQGESRTNGPCDLIIEHSNGTLYLIAQTYADTTIARAFWYCKQDIALMAISPQGKLRFSAFYSAGECEHLPFSCMEDTDSHIILSGIFNIGNEQICPHECSTASYGFTMKVDTLGKPYSRTVTSMQDNTLPLSFTLLTYPNPASELLTIQLQNTLPSLVCEIFDIHGHRLMQKKIEHTDRIELPITEFAKGYYLCRLTTPHTTKSIPFVMQ